MNGHLWHANHYFRERAKEALLEKDWPTYSLMMGLRRQNLESHLTLRALAKGWNEKEKSLLDV